MKVHLRKRKQTKSGKISLYLEIYKGTIVTPEGKRKVQREYEYLNLYLEDKPQTPAQRQQNKQTLQLAEGIKAKRELEIKNGQHGFSSGFKSNTNFIEYFKSLAEKRHESKGNYGNWDSTLKHLIKFAGKKVTFREISPQFCENFKQYLAKEAKKTSGEPLASSSISSYFNKFRSSLKQATREQIIPFNPCENVSTPKVVASKREHLTLEELKAVAKAECRYEVLKNAFLFSCLTGLRWSDVQKLTWDEVQQTDDGTRIVFNQKKTKGLQYLDISEQARAYLGERTNGSDRVFIGLKYSSYMNVALQQWMLRAGITKSITFHCARHTFAVLQLSLGTEIYTLSKLLGHTEIRTTQIYADIIDQKKKEAVNKIPDINI